MRWKSICFPPPRQELTPPLTRLESFGFIIIRSAHWQTSKKATDCRGIVAAANKRLCGRRLQSVTSFTNKARRKDLAFFFFNTAKTKLHYFLNACSEFTLLSPSLLGSEQIVAPARMLAWLYNLALAFVIVLKCLMQFSDRFYRPYVFIVHCTMSTSITFMQSLIRGTCEGSTKKSGLNIWKKWNENQLAKQSQLC